MRGRPGWRGLWRPVRHPEDRDSTPQCEHADPGLLPTPRGEDTRVPHSRVSLTDTWPSRGPGGGGARTTVLLILALKKHQAAQTAPSRSGRLTLSKPVPGCLVRDFQRAQLRPRLSSCSGTLWAHSPGSNPGSEPSERRSTTALPPCPCQAGEWGPPRSPALQAHRGARRCGQLLAQRPAHGG